MVLSGEIAKLQGSSYRKTVEINAEVMLLRINPSNLKPFCQTYSLKWGYVGLLSKIFFMINVKTYIHYQGTVVLKLLAIGQGVQI